MEMGTSEDHLLDLYYVNTLTLIGRLLAASCQLPTCAGAYGYIGT